MVATLGFGSGLYLVASSAPPAGASSGFSGTVTGTAFRDYNADGVMETSRSGADPALDTGISGVTVDAYDSDNNLVGTATTAAGGTYTLNFTGSASGTVRIEFSDPSGFSFGPEGSGSSGIVSGGDLQYVTSGGTANVGYVAPGDYCNADPTIVIPCVQGAFDQANAGSAIAAPTNLPALFTTSYDTSGDLSADDVPNNTSSTLVTQATVAQIGSVWGEATYNVDGGEYALSAAFFKRHAELGQGGSGALGDIYITDLASGTPNGAPWVVIPNAGTDPRLSYYNVTSESQMTVAQWMDDTPGYDDADEIGLGGESISPDQTTLYVVNLTDRNLYAVPITAPTTPGGAPTAGTPTVIPLPLTLPGATACPGTVEPFAVTAEATEVYVGLTCSGPSASDLAGYVYSLNIADDYAPSAAPVLTIPFSGYARGDTFTGNALSAAWNPWAGTTFESTGTAHDWASYPQPQVSAITFDEYGNMTVGVKDRNGDQVGAETPAPGTTTPDLQGITGGDMLLACTNGSGTWTLESDGSCASSTEGATLSASGAGNPGLSGVGGVGDGFGPGGGEFYFQHYVGGGKGGGSGSATVGTSPSHDHTVEGGLAQVPGFADVVATHFDPVSADINGTDSYWRTGGFDLQSNQTGADDSTGGGTIVYSGNPSDNEAPSAFSKADGLGNVAVLCSDPPVQIGNRVFIDANHDGLEDAGDPGVAGVTVTLETVPSGGGTPQVLGTTTTNSNGEYLFDSNDVTGGLSATTRYQIAIDTPSDFALGGPLAGYEPTIYKASLIDPAVNSVGVPVTGTDYATATVTTPAQGADLDNDFGFVNVPTCAVGDTAFLDSNKDGLEDGDETGLSGVTVTLYDATTDKPVTTTADGAALTNPVSTTSSGFYLFDDVACGSYYEVFGPPAGDGITQQLGPSTTAVQSTPAPSTGQTPVFTLGAGAPDNEPSTDFSPPTGVTVAATTIDPDEDVGILPPTCAVGDTVFVDTNGNGSQDAGEPGLAGVTVTLYTAAGTKVATTTTDNQGKYVFDGVACGASYYENFSGAPAGYNLTQQEPPPASPGPVLSQPSPTTGNTPDFTLGTGDADNEPTSQYSVPTGLSVSAETVDPTVDAGYTAPTCAVGDTVFADYNADGTQGSGEPGLYDVTVTLYSSDGTKVTTDAQGNSLTNPVTTDDNGKYLFDDVACGASYYILFTPPAGYSAAPTLSPSTTAVDSTESTTTDKSPVFTLGPGEPDNQLGSTFTAPDGLTFTSFEVDPTIDAGFVPDTCSVGQTTFSDTNGDGTQDNGEPVLPGVSVTLYTSGGTVVTTNADGQTITNPVVTDSHGHYLFTDLACGQSYYETFTGPTGYTLTTQTAPSETAVDSVPAPSTGQTPDFTLGASAADNEPTTSVTLPAGLSDSSQTIDPAEDAGFQALCSIGDTVFADPAGTGVYTAGDPGLAGVTVTLYTAAGTKVTSTTTNSSGYYVFNGVSCGSYYLTFVPPAGLGYAPDPQKSPSGVTSVVSTPDSDGQTPVFTVGPGDADNEASSTFTPPTGITVTSPTVDPVEDAGFTPPTCAVGDTAFVDRNGDGIEEAGEPGLAGVTVTLYSSSGQVVTNQASGAQLDNPIVTGSSGTYLFEGLACGSYHETFTAPDGYIPTSATAPSLSANDSQIDSSGTTPTFVLGPGQADNEAASAYTLAAVTSTYIDPAEDAGFLAEGTITGVVTADQSGSPGVGGATVTITDPTTGAVVATVTTAANGGYTVSGLPPGDYDVTITPPNGDTLLTVGHLEVGVAAGATTTFNAEVRAPVTQVTTAITTPGPTTGTTTQLPTAVPAGGGLLPPGPGRPPFGSWGMFALWSLLLLLGLGLVGTGGRLLLGPRHSLDRAAYPLTSGYARSRPVRVGFGRRYRAAHARSGRPAHRSGTWARVSRAGPSRSPG